MVEDDGLLVRLCKDSGISYEGGFANGWSGIIKKNNQHAGAATVNYFHKSPLFLDAVPLAAVRAFPLSRGCYVSVIDDEGLLESLCYMRAIKYRTGFCGRTGTIKNIDAELGVAIVHFVHKRPHNYDCLPLAALWKLEEFLI